MKVAVIGATGFIGIHLVRTLLQDGYEVVALVRSESNTQKLDSLNVPTFIIDFFHKPSLIQTFNQIKPDVVIQSAGAIKALSYRDYYKNNSLLTHNIVTSLPSSENGQKPYFIYISSAAACGPSLSLSHLKNADSPLTPISFYGRSKARAERFIKRACVNYSIIRPVAVYGPEDFAMPTVFNSVKTKIRICLGSIKNTMDLVHVSDLVHFIQKVLEIKPKNETYIFGDKIHYTQENILQKAFEQYFGTKSRWLLKITIPNFLVLWGGCLVRSFSKLTKKSYFFNLDKAKESIQKHWSFDMSKAYKIYEPEINMDKGFKQLKEWLEESKKA